MTLGTTTAGEGVENRHRFYFLIGSVDSFERKLDEAQKELGVNSSAYVPVKFSHEVSLFGTLLEFLPTLLFFGWAYWLVSRQMRNMPGGFGGAAGPLSRMGRNGGGSNRGAGGLFGMGKANITTADKNSKEKVCCWVLHGVFLTGARAARRGEGGVWRGRG
eukprot:GHUV01030721.1.p1 GENE.GHUV01030721.1~~GHUV01030721.1.p1  ORF type:complete len:188 (+),score=33.32 GHUV01030721.1:83-565(+)